MGLPVLAVLGEGGMVFILLVRLAFRGAGFAVQVAGDAGLIGAFALQGAAV